MGRKTKGLPFTHTFFTETSWDLVKFWVKYSQKGEEGRVTHKKLKFNDYRLEIGVRGNIKARCIACWMCHMNRKLEMWCHFFGQANTQWRQSSVALLIFKQLVGWRDVVRVTMWFGRFMISGSSGREIIQARYNSQKMLIIKWDVTIVSLHASSSNCKRID